MRPPGHHAWRGRAGGFCFLCNAGIAARHAQKEYGVGKVAVLDFDVHHGDGEYLEERIYGNILDNYAHRDADFSDLAGISSQCLSVTY